MYFFICSLWFKLLVCYGVVNSWNINFIIVKMIIYKVKVVDDDIDDLFKDIGVDLVIIKVFKIKLFVKGKLEFVIDDFDFLVEFEI